MIIRLFYVVDKRFISCAGIVNLFPPMRALGREVGGLRFTLPSGGHGQDRDLLPGLEAFPQFLPIRRCGKPMSARTEVLHDRSIRREKSLGVARRFEPLHTLLPLTCRLMGVLRPIVQIAVLPMFHAWKNLALGGSVALEFVGDDHARHVG